MIGLREIAATAGVRVPDGTSGYKMRFLVGQLMHPQNESDPARKLRWLASLPVVGKYVKTELHKLMNTPDDELDELLATCIGALQSLRSDDVPQPQPKES